MCSLQAPFLSIEYGMYNLGLELIDDPADLDVDETPEDELKEEPDEPTLPEISSEPEESEEPEESPPPVQKVLVAVIDTGLDTGHEIFEGYLHGDAPDTETELLSYAHGTHIGGIIINAAKEAGADIELLPIKVFDNGNAYTSDIIAAIEYATAMGAQIVNCSFGSLSYNQALYEAIEASNALFVCAVGNNRRDFDVEPSYPAGYDLPNVISVASVNADGGFSYFSNYGSESIDLAALGRDVHSALPGNKYGMMTGTSMSAAYVTGAATSVLSFEEMTAEQLKDLLLNSADELSNLHNKVINGRRVNTANAIAGDEGSYLTLNPEDDFDVHGYQRTDEENLQLFSSLDVVDVKVGYEHSLALASDGTVWAWGCNNYGQLGDGTTINRTNAIQVLGINNVKAIAVGRYHSIALDKNGSVWAWGYNRFGQLGNSTNVNRLIPVQVIGLESIKSISTEDYKSIATNDMGEANLWGLINNNPFLGKSEESTEDEIGYFSQEQTYMTYWFPFIPYIAITVEESEYIVFDDGSANLICDIDEIPDEVWLNIDSNDGIASLMIGEHDVYALGYEVAYDSELNVYRCNISGILKDYHMENNEMEVVIHATSVNGACDSITFNLLLTQEPFDLRFEQGSYLTVIPNETMSSKSFIVQAVFSGPRQANDSEIVYSLATPYPGVSINSVTGVVTISSAALPGTVTVKASCEGLEATVQLILREAGAFDSELELEVEEDGYVYIALTARDIVSFEDMSFIITYDETQLQLLDAAVQAYGSNITAGFISDTGITIESISDGELILTLDKDIPVGKVWSGTITILKFKALETGIVSISVS